MKILYQDVALRLGGFRILPHKYGLENRDYFDRAIIQGFAPFYADVAYSTK
jgi:hypothetical protein